MKTHSQLDPTRGRLAVAAVDSASPVAPGPKALRHL
jgi:hypothetical protein